MSNNADVYEAITARMITALEKGTVPWAKPWGYASDQARSMSTGRAYQGINTLLLGLTALERGYASPWWATMRQIDKLGGRVRKGQSRDNGTGATQVLLWKSATRRGTDEHGDPEVHGYLLARGFWVYNAEQTEGLPARFYPTDDAAEVAELPAPEAVLSAYLAAGPDCREAEGDRAYYAPARDQITLPLRSQFKSAESYYAAKLHEAGHSTGHKSRLDREGIGDAGAEFGCTTYAKEELIAQMAAAMLLAATGTDTDELFQNSAAYIADWLTALRNDVRLVTTAASAASKAADLILAASQDSATQAELAGAAA